MRSYGRGYAAGRRLHSGVRTHPWLSSDLNSTQMEGDVQLGVTVGTEQSLSPTLGVFSSICQRRSARPVQRLGRRSPLRISGAARKLRGTLRPITVLPESARPIRPQGRGMSPEVVLYTRPRCPYSFRLRRKLRRRGLPFREVNIWQDASAAAAVRAVAGGDETVPTVQVGDRWLVNPTVEEVCAAAGYDLRSHR